MQGGGNKNKPQNMAGEMAQQVRELATKPDC